ncbi:hypothetical protein [Xanthomonas sp. GPE 39]|uniref:hypothetical protein n=1 Tax=Xanthomonas sp. GPE 39 TaxID=1583099 RepID=UPI0006962069|nr:hypothetical protein [Xanthomonas sp. GPE 39]
MAQKTPPSPVGGADALEASAGDAISQSKRRLIKQGVDWTKRVNWIRQAIMRSLEQMFLLSMTAYHLTRMQTLG